MGRAAGKHKPRHGAGSDYLPGSPLGRETGVSDKDIPGGREHVVQPLVPPPTPPPQPVKGQPFHGMMAHGVPPEGQHRDRMENAPFKQRAAQQLAPRPVPPVPVPVYQVEGPADQSVRRSAETKRVTCPQAGSTPAQIVGSSGDLVEVLLLNEDAANPARFSHELAALASTDGALLPAAMTSYLKLRTQDDLFIVSNGANSPVVSVVIVTERKA